MNFRTRTRILCSALAIMGSLSAVTAADAAVYRGRFHPVYGTPFDDPRMAWGGTLKVTVDDTCVQPGLVSVLGCPGGMTINEVTVDLFRSDINGVPVSGGLQQTMNFGAGAGLFGLNWLLNFDANKKLVGAYSTAFDAIAGNAGALTMWDGSHQAWFSLQFLGDYAQLYWFDKEPLDHVYPVIGTVPDEVLLTAGLTVDNPFFPFGPATITIGGVCRSNGVTDIGGLLGSYVNPDRCGWSDPDNLSRGAFITFEQIPEPATYLLVPAALAMMGAAGIWSRRRHAPKPRP